MNEDFQVDFAHILEQGEAAIINFAKMLGSYHRELIKEQFTPEQAFELVRDYQMESIRNQRFN